MSNSKGFKQNNEYDISNYDPSQFAISNGILIKYLGHATTVSIPEIVNQISSSAFMGCSEVEEIAIPDSVKGIDRYSFVSCACLKVIHIGFGVSVIPMGAFAELPNLESVIVTDSISEIEDFAFKNCRKLNSIEFLTKKYRDPVTAVEKGKAFEMMIAGKPAKIEYVDALKDTPMLTSIGNYAFSGCLSLDVSSLKDKAEQVGICAFDGCFSEINGNIGAEDSFVEKELSDVVYSSEDDIFIRKTDEVDVYSSDIDKAEEICPEDEIKIAGDDDDTKETDPIPAEEKSYLEPDEDDDNSPAEYLIKGFIVADNEIQNEISHRVIHDAPVESLSLSTRSYNAIYRIKEKITKAPHERVMISDLLKIAPDQLLQFRNMGEKSAEEIIDRVTVYLSADISDEEKISSNKQYTIAPDYEVIDGVITHVDSGKIVEDILIDYIGLGVRATNSLHRGHVMKLSELICLSVQQLKELPYIGAKSVSEILETVPRYLSANQITELSADSAEDEIDLPAKVNIPPLSMKHTVLAPDYAVVDGVIYHRKTLKVIPDIPIEKLNLSVRSLNCLIRNGNVYASTLIGIPLDDFRSIRNLGQLSVNEIQEKLEQYLDKARNDSKKQAMPASTVSSEQIFSVLHEHEFESVDIELILQTLPDAIEEEVKAVLADLAKSHKIVQDGELFAIHHVSFFEEIDALSSNNSSQLDERAIRILRQRASGKTLEEVGQQEGMTRERVRQIENRALGKLIRRGHIVYEEDRYAYLFTTYAFEREFYFDYLDAPMNIWYYLNLRYARGKTDTSEALEDETLSVATRRAIDKYIHRDYIQVDGNYILMQRAAIEDVVAEKYCKDEVTLEAFFGYYEKFILENGITDERLQMTKSVKASRSNRLAESNKILWKQNRRLRYYDIDGRDFTELLETLNLGRYENIEFSTRKFLIDYPDLMKRYDLRDEYEVHNLLKKIHAEKENPQMVFGRMPNLRFGVFDRDSAVKEVLFAMAPVNQDDLAEMISLEYGTREDTIKANWLTCISEYYHQGMYSVEYEDIPEDHMQKLKAVLTDDFYFMTELRKIYRNLIDNADLSLLSTYNLKKMGFLVGSTYVIQHYPTAEAYFDHLLTSDDVVDVAPISKRYTGLTAYSGYLARIKHDMRIIEFEPYQYINIRRLEKLGFTKEKLREYGSQVWSYLVDDGYFTIQSIRNDGFSSELDGLGFGDLFYASILKEDERFSWQKVGNAVVFNPKGNSFTIHDFLVDYITNAGSVNVDDFSLELRERFGIELDRYSIIEKVKGSDVYYDSIMEKLYADYSLYFEEI